MVVLVYSHSVMIRKAAVELVKKTASNYLYSSIAHYSSIAAKLADYIMLFRQHQRPRAKGATPRAYITSLHY